jgi:hypothetical protein
MFQLLVGLLTFGLWIYALIDAILSDQWQVKHLPKVTWVLIIIFLPFVGSILWFVVGKERDARYSPAPQGTFGDPRRHEDLFPASSTEHELAELDREIAAHERDARIRRLEAELQARRAEREGG